MTWENQYRLSPQIRLLASIVNLFCGIIPGMGLFFIWVERNCSIPALNSFLGWPIIHLPTGSVLIQCFWNFSLFLAFGFFHSFLAQRKAQAKIGSVLPPQLLRSFYLCITGLSLLGMMACWQPTQIRLWLLPLDTSLRTALSLCIFWFCMAIAGHLLTRMRLFEFIGFNQLKMSVGEIGRTEGNSYLITDGIYRWVRHPVYTFTFAAFVITPEMTLDRFLVASAMITYLTFGIPIEERKLIQHFGDAYIRYRLRTPALFPLQGIFKLKS